MAQVLDAYWRNAGTIALSLLVPSLLLMGLSLLHTHLFSLFVGNLSGLDPDISHLLPWSIFSFVYNLLKLALADALVLAMLAPVILASERGRFLPRLDWTLVKLLPALLCFEFARYLLIEFAPTMLFFAFSDDQELFIQLIGHEANLLVHWAVMLAISVLFLFLVVRSFITVPRIAIAGPWSPVASWKDTAISWPRLLGALLVVEGAAIALEILQIDIVWSIGTLFVDLQQEGAMDQWVIGFFNALYSVLILALWWTALCILYKATLASPKAQQT